MRTVNEGSEVFHSAVSVRILKEHPTNVLPTEVHLMRQFQHRCDSNVAATQQSKKDITNAWFYSLPNTYLYIYICIQCLLYIAVCVKYILGSGLHNSNGLRMAAWVDVESPSFVLPVTSK